MRKSEILGLTWSQVDLRARIITLAAADTKEEMPKTVPIGEELLRELNGLPRGIHKAKVYLYRGRPLNRFRKALNSACERSSILNGRDITKGGFIFHDLRHTFITDMRRAGVPRTVTAAITGHAIRDMNERYHVIEAADKLEAIARLEEYRRKEAARVDQAVDQKGGEPSNLLNLQR
jgi:integrase